MPMFTASLPEANYGTLIASTGGHWTTTVFHGFRNESRKDSGYGIEKVLEFFDHAMKKWAADVQEALYADQRLGNGGLKAPRRVVVRAYLPGHEDCHNIFEPWTYLHKPNWDWYNWSWIKDFNAIFQVRILAGALDLKLIYIHYQRILSMPRYPDIFYLPIDNPALLRPDAVGLCIPYGFKKKFTYQFFSQHASGDCLHIMTGVGVMEGWSHYIWHFVSRELAGRIR